jgi:hypothetical protein
VLTRARLQPSVGSSFPGLAHYWRISTSVALSASRQPPGRSAGFRPTPPRIRAPGGVPERLNGAVSKTVVGLSVHRGFESLPLRYKSEFISFAGTLLVERPLARVLARVNQRQRTPALAEVHSPAIPPAGALRVAESNWRHHDFQAQPRTPLIGSKSLRTSRFSGQISRTAKSRILRSSLTGFSHRGRPECLNQATKRRHLSLPGRGRGALPQTFTMRCRIQRARACSPCCSSRSSATSS